MYFWDRGGRLCLLTHPVIPFMIITWQNYFYQTFCHKKTFPEACNRVHLPIWNLEVAPSAPLCGARGGQFSHLQIAIFKKHWIHIFFESKVHFSRYLASSIFLLHPVYNMHLICICILHIKHNTTLCTLMHIASNFQL